MKTFLHLETGERLEGISIGTTASSEGEVVFSTGMTGYIESMTDPSFAGQILVFTYPLIGNYGIPKPKKLLPSVMANMESDHVWVQGVVVGEACDGPSHYQSRQSFADFLCDRHISGIAGVDTRMLTHIIREKGCMRGKISPVKTVTWEKSIPVHWVKKTSCRTSVFYPSPDRNAKHVVLIDCGVKHGIMRALLQRKYAVTRIPWDRDPRDIKNVDSIIVSNGPGDPKSCDVTIRHVKKALACHIPYLGICLGHQILSLAIGADTYKLRYGHRGINQPCIDVGTGKAYVTSQNHGYAVKRETIPHGYREWFTNLNDQTNEGIIHTTKPVRSVQFHPEGYPGPSDTSWIWDLVK